MAIIDAVRANELSWQGALTHRLNGIKCPHTVLYSQYDVNTMDTLYAARIYLGREATVTPPFTDIQALLDYSAVIIRMHYATKEN